MAPNLPLETAGMGSVNSELTQAGSPATPCSRTLLTDYAAGIISLQLVFVAFVMAFTAGWSWGSLTAMLTAGWCAWRSLGRSFGTIYAPLVTISLLLCGRLTAATETDSVLTFTKLVLTTGLLFNLWLDVVELTARFRIDVCFRQRIRSFAFRWGIAITLTGFGIFVAVYGLLLPYLDELQHQQAVQAGVPLHLDRLSMLQSIRFHLAKCLTATFFFIVGTCVGSFLNVVIYRVPKRISVLIKPSHCPGCNEKVKGKDNLPIFGWLKLSGQCRNCQIPISSRYPTVELTIGLVFLALYFFELISGGRNLPGRTPNTYPGVLWILFYTKWDMVGLYFYHCTVFCVLFSWAMIRRDHEQVPLISLAVVFVGVIAPPLFEPYLYPLKAYPLSISQGQTLIHSLATCALGIAAGAMLCGLIRILAKYKWSERFPNHLPSWLLLGAALGWQAVLGVFCLMAIWRGLQKTQSLFFDQPIEPSTGTHEISWLMMPGIMLLHQLIWRPLVMLFTGS